MQPRLKSYARRLDANRITLVPDAGVEITLEDPHGQVLALLDILDGTRTEQDITHQLQVRWPTLTEQDVAEGLATLDEAGMLEDGAALSSLSNWQQERYFSNLAFFGTYATLERSRFAFQERLGDCRVLLLGVGGLGSTVLYNLAGMGVRRLTLLDCDRVELKNFARQFLYSESDLGKPKVAQAADRIRAFNSEIELEVIEDLIRNPAEIATLLPGIDLVVGAIDQPREVRFWINEACVPAGVPFVTGGTSIARGSYFSVDPGRSGCMECWLLHSYSQYSGPELVPAERANRGIGPVASLLGSLVSMECLRFLSHFAPPISAGCVWLVDFASGQIAPSYAWPQMNDCRLCGDSAKAAEGAGNTLSAPTA